MERLERVFTMQINDAAKVAPLYPGDVGIVQSHAMSLDDSALAELIRDSAIADIAEGLFGGSVWYWSEQAWLKRGAARRTAWHQDLSYIPFSGDGFVALWIPLDALPAANVLEVIRASHRGPLYNAVTFAPDDDTAPLFDDPALERMPDIENARETWDIVVEAMDRGDVLAFHPGCLHGGAPVFEGQQRRAMSFRLFSDRVVYRPLPLSHSDSFAHTQDERRDALTPGLDRLSPGEPIYSSGAYRRVRPWTGIEAGNHV